MTYYVLTPPDVGHPENQHLAMTTNRRTIFTTIDDGVSTQEAPLIVVVVVNIAIFV